MTAFGLTNSPANSQVSKRADSLGVHSIYQETTESKFEIISDSKRSGHTYRSVESNFKPVSIQLKEYDQTSYFANIITTTRATTSMESAERNIKIKIKSFDNPGKTIIEIDKDCYDIDLQNRTYRTVKYGCCTQADHYEIFDYENKQIVAGDRKIVTGFIPNSRLLFYVGFTRNVYDSTMLGVLHYATTNGNRFAFKIRSSFSNLGNCDIFNPNIYIKTRSGRDKFDKIENTYIFWSLDGIEDENLINNFTIKFKLDCIDNDNFKTLTIPIINGKPFGKNQRVMELELN